MPGFDAPEVNTYSLETTIAEKLDAILSLMEFSSIPATEYCTVLQNIHQFTSEPYAAAISNANWNAHWSAETQTWSQVSDKK